MRCQRCSLHHHGQAPDDEACPLEASRSLPWHGALAWVDYDYPVDGWIHALKFQSEASLAEGLGFGLAQAVMSAPAGLRKSILSLDAVIPLPLSRERLARRGYNQTLLIARAFARALPQTRLDTQSLQRIRHGPALSLMPSEGRHGLIRGSYAVVRPAKGKRVGLLDDVMTTGATLAEATRTLRDAGASEVIVMVAARTPQHTAGS